MSEEDFCKQNIRNMLRRSQTKVIFPLITLGLLRECHENGTVRFSDTDIRRLYLSTVSWMKEYLGHDLHIGGKYYDAYPSRNLPRYDVLRAIGGKQYELLSPYVSSAEALIEWIPEAVKHHIIERLGIVPQLGDHISRAELSASSEGFLEVVGTHIDKNPTNFEIFSFAVIKVHLERFACKVYRDTRTSAHDRGVDLSTNFGVVYQVKKLKVYNRAAADNIYAELKVNFDRERLSDGNVILVIDDISKEIKNYLIDMKVDTVGEIAERARRGTKPDRSGLKNGPKEALRSLRRNSPTVSKFSPSARATYSNWPNNLRIWKPERRCCGSFTKSSDESTLATCKRKPD